MGRIICVDLVRQHETAASLSVMLLGELAPLAASDVWGSATPVVVGLD